MNSKSYKFRSVFFGFIIGCVVGGSVVWWQKAYLIDELIEKGIHFFSFHNEKYDNQLNNDNVPKLDKNPKIKTSNFNSKDKNYAVMEAETTINHAINVSDSINLDSVVKKSDIIDDFSVVKEELLYSRSVHLINKDLKNDQLNKVDTIFLDENIGNNNTSAEYNIEFWKSPINFKGYKTGKNKIVLFGIYEFKKLSLKKQNDILYLQCDDKYYIIENTDNYKPLSLLSNKLLINKLGEK